MKVIEENSSNFLLLTDDGGTVTKSKSSDLNQLLYGHNLNGLLEEGNTVWTKSGKENEPSVTIIPSDDAKTFNVRVDGRPDLQLGSHHKTDLIDVLAEIYDEDTANSVEPLLKFYDRIRGNMVRGQVLDPFGEKFGELVEIQEGGWFINGHCLLTYEGEFYHPNHKSRNRSGSVIGEGTSVEAYNLSIDDLEQDMDCNLTIDGEQIRLTRGEMTFLAKAMWAIKNTPNRT